MSGRPCTNGANEIGNAFRAEDHDCWQRHETQWARAIGTPQSGTASRLHSYASFMSGWADSLPIVGAILGFAGAYVPARMQIRHERATRSQDEASRLLERILAVSDAVQFALNSSEDNQSIENAAWLSGELPGEVGRSTPFLPRSARASAFDASANLRLAACRLKSASAASGEDRASRLAEARDAYEESQQKVRDLAAAFES